MRTIRCLCAALLLLGTGISCPPFNAAAEPKGSPGAVQAAEPATYLAELSQQLNRPWPANRTVNIVCHGHSVPAGYFQTPQVDTFNAYPHLLHRGLKERFPYAVVNVIVTAIGGEDSVQGCARFERDVLSHHPDLITIDYALNDRRLGLERAKAAWASMIEMALAHHTKVILLTPTADAKAKLLAPDDPLCQHAAQIKALAATYHVGLADSLQRFQQYVRNGGKLEELLSQANHPNRKGHELVCAELLKWFP